MSHHLFAHLLHFLGQLCAAAAFFVDAYDPNAKARDRQLPNNTTSLSPYSRSPWKESRSHWEYFAHPLHLNRSHKCATWEIVVHVLAVARFDWPTQAIT
jgi:hypothetical protein